ncbi:MAG: hypothetical protein KDD39_15050 [Bdellovibrionales bacterium]|nr:hypothetical protein [Bdellovibrionales bacterium]
MAKKRKTAKKAAKTTKTKRPTTKKRGARANTVERSSLWGILATFFFGFGFVYFSLASQPISEKDLVQLDGTLKDWLISGSNYPSDQFYLREYPKAAFSVDKAAFDLLIAEDHLRPGAKFRISVKKLDIDGIERGIAGILPQDVSVYSLSLGDNTYLSLLDSTKKWGAQRQLHLVFGCLMLLLAATLAWTHGITPAALTRAR